MNSSLESFRLVVFRVVAERLSFTQAATILHLSQPAVTSHIQALESELKTRLFERASSGTTLTPAGQRLYAFAAQVDRLAQQTLRDIGSFSGDERGRLCLGASTTIAQYLLPSLLARFVEAHPGLDLRVVSANTAEIVAQVLARKIELGLIEGPPGSSEVKLRKFVADEVLVIVGLNHPFASAPEPPSLAELAREPLLVRECGSGTRRVVEDALRRGGLELRTLQIVMEVDSTEAIKSGVEAGLGVGFVSRWALRQGPGSYIRPVRIRGLEIHREFQFIHLHGPEPDGPAGAFLRFARGYKQYLQPAG
jgi:DNA-binding transcriptional LysR family regulator